MRGSRIVVIEIYLTNQTGGKMLILYEGELLHTDSSTDVLEHYGMKGMKWGKRLGTSAKKVANYYEYTNRMNRKIDKNVERRNSIQKKLDSLNKEMSTRSNFRNLRLKTAASQAALYGAGALYGGKKFGNPVSNMALGAAIGGGYGAVKARKINREKRSKLVGAIVDTNANIADVKYKLDKRSNKKSYKNTSKSLNKERKKALNDVSNKQDRKLVKKEYSSKLRKAKRTYKDNKYANREKLDRFYDYNYINNDGNR